jgi:GT2 family glycosyltransferase
LEGLASVIIVTFNHRKYLEKCLGSILDQDYPHEIIIVDNDSHDGTPEFIETGYPQVKVIRNKNNGYGAGNNLGVSQSSGEYIVILNPDTIVEQGWLRELIVPLTKKPGIITAPKILLYDGSAINTIGNINHFTGLTFTRGLNEPPQSYHESRELSGVSGACFAISKEDYLKMGGFDERFFLYNEDSEFSWRAHIYDISIVFIPSSVLRHDYSLNVSPQKLYYLEKGRYLILKTYFSWKLWIVLIPSFILAEILTFGYAARFGWTGISFKARAFYEGLILTRSAKHRDGEKVLGHLEKSIPLDQLVSNGIERAGVRMCNWIFSWNFTVLVWFFY